MLGKLMKYEWQATWKLLLPANLLIVVMTFFGCMAVRLNLGDIDNDGIVFGAVMILVTYVGSMFVVMIGTAIFLIYRFYTSTYGDQGYLLHTLPVDKHHIIIAKVLVSSGWVLFCSFLMYVSVVAIFMAEDGLIPEVIGSVGTVVETAGGAGSFLTGVMSVLAFVVSIVARVLR